MLKRLMSSPSLSGILVTAKANQREQSPIGLELGQCEHVR